MFRKALVVVYPVLVILGLSLTAAAQSDRLLYSFCDQNPVCPDGAFPMATVMRDSVGNLYGTTYHGGGTACNNGYGCGEVFELSPYKATSGANVVYTQKVLYRFPQAPGDGFSPEAGLVMDSAGNLYGTTAEGGLIGANGQCEPYGCGTVFQLVRGDDGNWTENILWRFCSVANCADGISPTASLVFDAAGNLYGTAASGGTGPKPCPVGCGVVFELMRAANGVWLEKVLHSFAFKEGAFPEGGVIFDAAGNLYGTTNSGGSGEFGTVFELSPDGDQWTEQVLYNFNGVIGRDPLTALAFDKNGNLLGTTFQGGNDTEICTYGCGIVFELTPNGNGQWSETTLYAFCPEGGIYCTDGAFPASGLTLANDGSLYGTTGMGGSVGGGVIYKVTPSNGIYTESTVYSFPGDISGTSEGYEPAAGVIFDPAGNLYGTTELGGSSFNCNNGGGCGTVYMLTPEALGERRLEVLK